jgi:hypothetical protein
MKIFWWALICTTLVTLGGAALAESDKDGATLNQIAGYRQWTRVNPDPVEVSVPVTGTGTAISIRPDVAS